GDQGFDIVAVFDRDPGRVGERVAALPVRDLAELTAGSAEGHFDLGVIATPVRAAQEVADLLVSAGVSGILNFAPRKLFVPAHVAVRNVDMTMEFEGLSFALTQAKAPRRRRAKE